ncbi:acetoacetate decarboxylase [Candidatus Magnetomorum sp. HK-1]|nr:acetoacetate decarboxylase [Candidatus Magnetomorum sp. HK-1]
MPSFFDNTRPGKTVIIGDSSYEMPILYKRDEFMGLYYTADARRVKSILPSSRLHPITLPNGRAIVVIAAYNYRETSIGPYGEVVSGIPCVYGMRPLPFTGFIPALLESRYPGFGVLVQHLPVTRTTARNAGRDIWGYTKFIADMHFDITPEHLECQMHDKDQHILTFRVVRRGIYSEDARPIITYSVKNNKLIKTIIPQKGTKRISLKTEGCFLKMGDHPVSLSIQSLGLSDKPLMSLYYPERWAILPEGTVIEENVQAFDGYMGMEREASHTVNEANISNNF